MEYSRGCKHNFFCQTNLKLHLKIKKIIADPTPEWFGPNVSAVPTAANILIDMASENQMTHTKWLTFSIIDN